MENLVKKFKSGQIITVLIWVIIIFIILLVGFNSLNQQKSIKGEFNKNRYSEDVLSANVYYLVGPIAEYTEGRTVRKECYIGIGEEDLYVIVTDKGNTTGVPIYDDSMTNEEIDNLKPVTIVGKTKAIESKLVTYLINTYNEIEGNALMTRSNYSDVFGRYYLDADAVNEDKETAYIIFIFDGLIIFFLALYISKKNKDNKKIKEQINKYKESGELEIFNADIESTESKLNKKLKVLMTDKYIYNFNGEIYGIPIEKISNAYTCCIINNKISKFDYIAIETKDNITYFIASKERDKKNKDFEKLLKDIKEKIK